MRWYELLVLRVSGKLSIGGQLKLYRISERNKKLVVLCSCESEGRVIERRIVGRSRCKIDASIEADVCYVADMSVEGARIVLPRAAEMPNSFFVALPWRDENLVRKRWQNKFHVGVEFELVSAIDARTLVKII